MQMIGAIVGDIVGSVYEWNNIKTKEFPLFQERCRFTDDTVMTVAVAEALMNGGERDDFIDAMHNQRYGFSARYISQPGLQEDTRVVQQGAYNG